MKLLVNDILTATDGNLIAKNNIEGKFNICTDTRTISSEDVFLPIVGKNFDGHDFINTALENGCKGILIDKKHSNLSSNFKNISFVIEVNDTLEAYLKIANFVRNKINPKVIAVTGSSGKTTTKEMLASVISEKLRTHKSKLNHNNEIGLCQTILTMPDDTEALVVEMGMRAQGEIELLSKYAQPDIAIITNIGTAHIGRLGSIENIAKAKCEITKFLKPDGTFISNYSPLVKNTSTWHGQTIYYDLKDTSITSTTEESSEFSFKGNTYQLNVSGEYNITNALAAIETGFKLGLTPQEINSGLLKYQPIENRWQIIQLSNNRKIINDSYNANPESVKASITAILSSYPTNKIYLILGDMGELGEYEEQLHREVGTFINNQPVYQLITVGDKAKWIAEEITNKNIKIKTFTSNNEVVKYLIDNFDDNSIGLIKASRSMNFDNIVNNLLGV